MQERWLGAREGVGGPLALLATGSWAVLMLLSSIFGIVFIILGPLVLTLLLAPMALGMFTALDWLSRGSRRGAVQTGREGRGVSEQVLEATESGAEVVGQVAPPEAVYTLDIGESMAGSRETMGEALMRHVSVGQGGASAIPYPQNTVLAVIDDAEECRAAVDELASCGLRAQELPPVHPRAGLQGSRGVRSTPWRVFSWFVADEGRMLRAYEDQRLAGHHVIAVAVAGEEQVHAAASISDRHGGHMVKRFGRWLITDLVPSPKRAVAAKALRDVDVFRDLSLLELGHVAAVGQEVRLPQGSTLARQGHLGTKVYCILEGQVELTTSSPRGEITVRIAGPGEALPLAALLGEGRLISTALAMTEVRAMEISCAAFQELCRSQPEIGMEVYRAIADGLGGRYRNTLTRLVGTLEQALKQADVFANV